MTGSASSPGRSPRKPSPDRSRVALSNLRRTTASQAALPGRRSGFTLIELLVTMVILTILVGLSAAGLAGVRTRGKAARTRSTIRKLHEAVAPASFQYLERRLDESMWTMLEQGVQAPPSPPATVREPKQRAAWQRMVLLRGLMVYEMPDQWVDVRDPGYLTSPVIKGYLRRVAGLDLALLGREAASAETLHLLVSSGLDSDALEAFREDEMGDADGDGAREFLDGFGRPIHFIRWAPGAATAVDRRAGQDPFDPYRLGGDDTFPLMPLIVSAGPDERYSTWRAPDVPIEGQGLPRQLPFDPYTPAEAGAASDGGQTDNITNIGMGQP